MDIICMDTMFTVLRRHHRPGDLIDYVIMAAVFYLGERLLVKMFPDMETNNRRIIAGVASIVALIIFKVVKLIVKNNASTSAR